MLKFDYKGNLTPYQPIPCTIRDIKKHLVDNISSDIRRENFEKYIHYSNELKKLLEVVKLRQWVNGSFVTSKKYPKDIDLVNFINQSLVQKLGRQLDKFRAGNSWTVYGVDAYLLEMYPDDSKYYYYTKSDMAYWYSRFCQTRANRRGNKFPKGFLEIMY